MTKNFITFQYIGAEKECKSKHLDLEILAQWKRSRMVQRLV